MGCGCKKNRIGMARKGKSVTVTSEDVVFAVIGGVGALLVNGALNKALSNQPEGTRQMVGKALPFAKIALGGYLAMDSKMDRKARFAGLGIAATGGVEAGIKMAPQYFSISGTGADVFDLIGNSNIVSLPVVPSQPLSSGRLFEEESVMGTNADEYAGMVL